MPFLKNTERPEKSAGAAARISCPPVFLPLFFLWLTHRRRCFPASPSNDGGFEDAVGFCRRRHSFRSRSAFSCQHPRSAYSARKLPSAALCCRAAGARSRVPGRAGAYPAALPITDAFALLCPTFSKSRTQVQACHGLNLPSPPQQNLADVGAAFHEGMCQGRFRGRKYLMDNRPHSSGLD